ncbi:hypothetical protein [Pandoraea sp. NPDC090278]|uniref:hypothetical protein n=1 Tax=Pandoraea sp. NPDC090278 TaxID=3364391 RepID=UPI003839DFDC
MKRKPMSIERGMSRARARWVAGWLVTLPGLVLMASEPVRAQTPAVDYSRFIPVQTSSVPTPVSTGAPIAGAPLGTAPGVYVQVIDGVIAVSNPSGTQAFQAGQFGFNPSYATPPVIVPQNPGMLFTPPPVFGSTPAPQTPPPPAPSGPMGTQTPADPVVTVPPVVSPPITPPVVLANGTDYYMMNWGSDGLANLGIGAGVFNSANALTKFTGTTVPFNVVSGVTATDTGALEDLGWGRWTSGSVSDHGLQFDLSTWKSGMPYVVGRPTLDANLPVSGTMTYALAGATKAIDMTTGAVGTLSGNLSIAFQNAQYAVTPNLNIAMSAGPTYVTGAGSTTVGPDGARATFSTMTQNVTGGACAGGCRFSTQGVLTGAAANNAGIVYSLTGPDLRVVGAAGFKR